MRGLVNKFDSIWFVVPSLCCFILIGAHHRETGSLNGYFEDTSASAE